MKKVNAGKKAAPQPSDQKIIGANSLQISEDGASSLIGGIVEKGFSEHPQSRAIGPSSAPRFTVLPFPVARHRSHGPHWAPKCNGISGGGYEEDNGEDENLTEFDYIAAFANPVQRKEKKGLDFSQWQELKTNDSTYVPHIDGKYKLSVESQQQNKVSEVTIPEKINGRIGIENAVNLKRSIDDGAKAQDVNMEDVDHATLEVVKKQEQEISDMAIDGEQSKLTNGIAEVREVAMEEMEPGLLKVSKGQMQVDMEKQNMSTTYTTSSYSSKKLGDEQGAMSLKSQIDAENHARLESMSADEIVEAQAEIMAKMSPGLIEVLKKRGKDKFEKQKCSSSDIASSGEVGNLQQEKNFTNTSTQFESDTSGRVITENSKDTKGGLGDDVQECRLGSSSLWDSWSKRVEAVRDLRFSLDGNVVKSDVVVELKTGNMSAHGGYSADNVSERDFLRTEGDPSAVGYTIKEALALTRSVIPGQRALALHLLASVLDKALRNICQNEVGCTLKYADRSIDWEAIWAFALGPEPELALSLRMSLDDNHNSVVLACVKVIHSVLSCDINESFFDISEKIETYQKDIYTAPIFRSRPEIDVGFLHGGYWKYNTKPSNILLYGEHTADDNPDGEHTIQDDIVVASQDFAAGLVRMGILPRICYLLETYSSAALDESIISILIAVARHSPTCVDAIMKCERLVQTVVNKFIMKDQMEISPSMIRTVTLFKVLARSNKKNCIDFIKDGIFQKVTWHLYQYAFSPNHWLKSGKENFKLSSALLVEQLRFWKVCIQYGYCVSYFSDLFSTLYVWLNAPTFEELIQHNILSEFAAITKEAFLVLAALSRRLPNFYLNIHRSTQTSEITAEGSETWCWGHVDQMVDLAIKWTALQTNSCLSKFFDWQEGNKSSSAAQDSTRNSLLWVTSAAMHMLSSVLESVIPEDTTSLSGGHVPWLPDFVPEIGHEIIDNGFLNFSGVDGVEYRKDPVRGVSFLQYLVHLRHQNEHETSIASVCCIQGLVWVVVSVNKLIQLANTHTPSSQCNSCSMRLSRQRKWDPTGEKILANGILESSLAELGTLMTTFQKLIASELHYVQFIEIFGRGGPAPGVGVGWGSSGGGFWSTTVLLAQMDAGLLISLLEIFQVVSAKDPPAVEGMSIIMQRIHSMLEVCLIAGPREGFVMDKVLDILLQVPILKYLDICIRRFLHLNKGLKRFGWEYKEEDYLFFSNILTSHFRTRWLGVKKKFKTEAKSTCKDQKTFKKGRVPLDTIQEDLDTSNMMNQEHYSTSLVVEWAHQRLPLPMHWFLSPISTINYNKPSDLPNASHILNSMQDTTDFLEVAKGGLFFLLGIEAMCTFLSSDFSPVQSVSVIWKLHSLSVTLLVGMGVLEEEKSRDVYETLQEVYGELLDKSRLPETREKNKVELLKFQSEIHESYSTFIETLVEQFAAISYGDLIYGRQITIYLHRCVEAPVRLAAWNALSNARALELLPSMEKCIAKVEGYLEPVEDDEKILEAYVKSWVSGALDRAATRGSVAFTLALHHLSSFIFGNYSGDKISLRNKLAKSLLRDYSRKQQHEGMMLDFIGYNKQSTFQEPGQEEVLPLQMYEIERRFKLLEEACEGNSSLLSVVEKLESFRKEQHIVT